MDDKEVQKFVEELITFMKNTNEMLASYLLRIENIEVDIRNLKKHKENKENRIILKT